MTSAASLGIVVPGQGMGDLGQLGVDAFIEANPGISMVALFGLLSFAVIGLFNFGSGAHAVVTSSRTKRRVKQAGTTGATLLVGGVLAAGGYIAYQYFNQPATATA